MDIRNILMIISLGLSVIIGLLVGRGTGASNTAEGGRSAKAGKKLLIGLSLDTLKEARWQADRDLFMARCAELGVDVKVNAANSDDAQQAKDVQSLIAAGVDALVIVPHDGVQMGASVDSAKREGIPVIAYDRLIKNCDLDLYVSFDNVHVGRQQAQYLVDHLATPGKGSIIRIFGSPTDNNAKLFKQGQDEVLKPYVDRGDIKIVFEDWAEDWRPENAKRIALSAITQGKPFEAVLASNDGTAGGAIQALVENGQGGKILVTGQDAEIPACQRIVAGQQAMTIYKPLKAMATLGAEMAVAMAKRQLIVVTGEIDNGKKQVPAKLLDVVTVTKDNMKDTVIKDGFHTEAEIYGK